MTAKNLAIVWAPNLLRCKDMSHKNNNNNNLKDIALQAVCTEFLIKYCDLLFASHLPTVSLEQSFELGIIDGKLFLQFWAIFAIKSSPFLNLSLCRFIQSRRLPWFPWK